MGKEQTRDQIHNLLEESVRESKLAIQMTLDIQTEIETLTRGIGQMVNFIVRMRDDILG
jgi:hypothetical protein